MKDIQKLIEQHTQLDGEEKVTDWAAIETAINDNINAIVAKQTDKVAEKVKGEVFADLGIDGVSDKDTLLKHIGTISQSDDSLKAEIEAKEKALQELNEKYGEVSQKTVQFEREKSLFELGITDPDARDYLLFNIGKRVNEETDWDKALASYKEEKPQFFTPQPTVATTGAKVNTTPKNEKLGFERHLAEMHPDVFKDN